MENALIFAAGMLVEWLYFTRSRFEPKILLHFTGGFIVMVAFGILYAFVDDFPLPMGVIFGAIMFVLAFSIIYKKKLLPHIDESKVLIWTTGVLVLLLEWNPPEPVMAIGIIVYMLVVSLNLHEGKLSKKAEILGYAWYCMVAVGLTIYQIFAEHGLWFFFSKASTPEVFITGMAFVYLLLHAGVLLELIPSDKQDAKDIAEHTKIMRRKFSSRQTKLAELLFILLLMWGAYTLNLQQGWVQTSQFVLLGVFITSFLHDAVTARGEK